MNPFSRDAWKVIIATFFVFAFANALPQLDHPFLNSIYKCSIVVLLYVPIAYFWNISVELNKMAIDWLKQIKKS